MFIFRDFSPDEENFQEKFFFSHDEKFDDSWKLGQI